MRVLHLAEVCMNHRPPVDIRFPWTLPVQTLAAVKVEERLTYCIRDIMKWRRALLCGYGLSFAECRASGDYK